jgi:hypothetical protein
MKYEVKVISGDMISIQSFIKIRIGFQTLLRGIG